MPPKNLFADSSSEDEVEVAPLKVNTAYADKYEAVKRKQELQRLSNKYANVSSSSDDTDEDDEAVLVTDDHELEFADLLKKLRTNDPSLKDTSVKFFANTASAPAAAAAAAKGERFTLKQEFQRTVVKAAEGALPDNTIDENDRVRRGLKRVTNAQEKAARDAFLKAAEEAENDAAEFTVKAAPTSKATERSGKAAEKVKTAFAAGEVVDENDQFLMNFFGSEVWRQTNKNVDYTWDQEAADEQDEIFYDDAEVWEREFQDQKYRHEEGIEATQIQTFARQQEGLLRAKDTRRKDARERKEERQHETELRATEELKRLKALKREEIAAFQKKIAEIAGLNSKSSSKKQNDKGKAPRKPSAEDEEEDARVAALISQAALEEDFDPETFDQQMNALFNDQYYDAIDDDEMAALEAEDTDFIPSGDDDDDDADEAVEDPKPKPSKTKTTRQALKEADVPEVLQDEADFLYPTQSISAAVSRQTHRGANQGGLTADELESQLEKKMDEYWRLHYHSVAGGVRTRFKYREVNAEKFGLDDEEILMLDDRTLNMIAPFNSYASYLNKQQNTKDRYKALHRRKNMRTLNPERRSRRYRTNTVALDPEAVSEQEGIEIAKAARRLNVGTADDVEEVLKKVEEDDAVRNASLMEKQVAKREERGGRERPTRPHEGEPARKAHFSEARQQHAQQHTRGPRPQQHGDRPPHHQSNRGQHHQRQAAPRKPE